jgi:hypothetical protein
LHEQQREQHDHSQQQHNWWRPSFDLPRFSRFSAASTLPAPPGDVPAAATADAAAAPTGGADGSSSSSSSSSSSARHSHSWPARRVRLLQLLDSAAASWLLIVMSLFVIFQEDIKYAVLPPTADLWFESITLVLLITFMLEIGGW